MLSELSELFYQSIVTPRLRMFIKWLGANDICNASSSPVYIRFLIHR